MLEGLDWLLSLCIVDSEGSGFEGIPGNDEICNLVTVGLFWAGVPGIASWNFGAVDNWLEVESFKSQFVDHPPGQELATADERKCHPGTDRQSQ